MAVLGGMLIVLGLMCFGSGQILQDPTSGGPPLEGPLARFGGLFMIAFGAAVVLILFLKKPSDHTKTDDHE